MSARDILYSRRQNFEEDPVRDLFVNVTYKNTSLTDVALAQVTQPRTRDIIPASKKYQYRVAVERLMLSTNYIPFWIPQMANPATNLTDTIYKIRMDYSTVAAKTYTQTLQWTGDASYEAAAAVSTTSDYAKTLDSDYLYSRSINHFLYLLNKAHKACWEGLKATTGGVGNAAAIDVSTPGNVGYYQFNSSSRTFTFTCTSKIYDANTDVVVVGGSENGLAKGPIKLYLNRPLMKLLRGFKIQSTIVETNDTWYRVHIYQNGDLYSYTSTAGALTTWYSFDAHASSTSYLLCMKQDSPSLAAFSTCTKILVTTDSIPIIDQPIPDKVQWGGSILTTPQTGSTSMKILADIAYPQDDYLSSPMSLIQYIPINLRFNDLVLERPVKDLEIKIWWVDIYNNMHPLKFLPGEGFDLTLHFSL